MQAAIGCEQLKKLDGFVERRIHNWNRIYDGLADLSKYLILPRTSADSKPSWFGFLLTLKEGIEREPLVRYIEDNGIQTRMLFAGNLVKHPCFSELKKDAQYRVVGNLKNTDIILNKTFWIGVYPGMTDEMVDYMIQVFHVYFKRLKAD